MTHPSLDTPLGALDPQGVRDAAPMIEALVHDLERDARRGRRALPTPLDAAYRGRVSTERRRGRHELAAAAADVTAPVDVHLAPTRQLEAYPAFDELVAGPRHKHPHGLVVLSSLDQLEAWLARGER